jgi:hypothetical protein
MAEREGSRRSQLINDNAMKSKNIGTKSKWWLISLSFIIYHLSFSPVGAQELPRSTVAYFLGMGPTNVLDTYLSQEKFSGSGLSLLATVERQEPGSHWTSRFEHQVNYSNVGDRTDTRGELQGDYTFLTGRLYRWDLSHKWDVQVGGMVSGNIGFIYNTANSNNPAQGRISVNLMPTATVSKSFRLWRKSWLTRYQLNLPLVGVMFSPNYGQSYYEIFSLGNYDHNVVVTTFVSAPSMRHEFTLGCALRPYSMLTIGYLGDYQQAKVNNLKSHIYSHRVMIGFVRKFSIIRHKL